jgi:hypothetical protein
MPNFVNKVKENWQINPSIAPKLSIPIQLLPPQPLSSQITQCFYWFYLYFINKRIKYKNRSRLSFLSIKMI